MRCCAFWWMCAAKRHDVKTGEGGSFQIAFSFFAKNFPPTPMQSGENTVKYEAVRLQNYLEDSSNGKTCL